MASETKQRRQPKGAFAVPGLSLFTGLQNLTRAEISLSDTLRELRQAEARWQWNEAERERLEADVLRLTEEGQTLAQQLAGQQAQVASLQGSLAELQQETKGRAAVPAARTALAAPLASALQETQAETAQTVSDLEQTQTALESVSAELETRELEAADLETGIAELEHQLTVPDYDAELLRPLREQVDDPESLDSLANAFRIRMWEAAQELVDEGMSVTDETRGEAIDALQERAIPQLPQLIADIRFLNDVLGPMEPRNDLVDQYLRLYPAPTPTVNETAPRMLPQGGPYETARRALELNRELAVEQLQMFDIVTAEGLNMINHIWEDAPNAGDEFTPQLDLRRYSVDYGPEFWAPSRELRSGP